MTECPYEHDDAAYVLGALSPAERTQFERHLATCPACRDAVAEVAALPALLGRVSPDDLRLHSEEWAEPSSEPSVGPAPQETPPAAPRPMPQPHELMAGLVDAVRAKRRRARWIAGWRYAAIAVAAAAVALVIGISLPSAPPQPDAQRATAAPTPPLSASPTPTSLVALERMTPVRPGLPVQAEVGLRSGAWGTEVVLHCWYSDAGGRPGPFVYQLVAYGPDRKADPLGSWTSGPGDDVRMTGMTRYPIGDLTRIQILGSRGTALLDYEVP